MLQDADSLHLPSSHAEGWHCSLEESRQSFGQQLQVGPLLVSAGFRVVSWMCYKIKSPSSPSFISLPIACKTFWDYKMLMC